jgi:hypothetical protein
MRSTSWRIFGIAGAGLIILISVSTISRRRGEAALNEERKLHMRVLSFQNENEKLRGLQLSPEEVLRLESVKTETDALGVKLQGLVSKTKDADSHANIRYSAEEPIPATDWKYLGHAEPKSTLQSVLWAASHGEAGQLTNLIALAPDARQKAEAMFAQLPENTRQEYRNPEGVLAMLMAGGFPKDIASMTVLGGGEWPDANAAAISARIDHTEGVSIINVYRLQKTEGGWQLVMPTQVLLGYLSNLTGTSQPIP